MLLLFSHQLTDSQKDDARNNWDVKQFLALPKELQNIWSNIDPNLEKLEAYLLSVYAFIEDEGNEKDLVLIQGDFGASYLMIKFAKEKNLIPLYATTQRRVKEMKNENGKMEKRSIFEHRRFRRYE